MATSLSLRPGKWTTVWDVAAANGVPAAADVPRLLNTLGYDSLDVAFTFAGGSTPSAKVTAYTYDETNAVFVKVAAVSGALTEGLMLVGGLECFQRRVYLEISTIAGTPTGVKLLVSPRQVSNSSVT